MENKKKLIDELSELAQICLNYKNQIEVEKKQKQEWLNNSLNRLLELWKEKYGLFYMLLCEAKDDDLIWWKTADKHLKEFEKGLQEVVNAYTEKKETNNGKEKRIFYCFTKFKIFSW